MSGPIAYRDGVLAVEGVALPEIATAVGTPFYAYASGAMESSYLDFGP